MPAAPPAVKPVEKPSAKPSVKSAAKSAVKQPPAAERVYAHIKEAVLGRRYEGGTLLTEGDLAEAVGVSRTPCARRCCGWRSRG